MLRGSCCYEKGINERLPPCRSLLRLRYANAGADPLYVGAHGKNSVLQRLVFALRSGEQNHAQVFAEVIAYGAHKISDILDEEKIGFVEAPFFDCAVDRACIEVALRRSRPTLAAEDRRCLVAIIPRRSRPRSENAASGRPGSFSARRDVRACAGQNHLALFVFSESQHTQGQQFLHFGSVEEVAGLNLISKFGAAARRKECRECGCRQFRFSSEPFPDGRQRLRR